MHMLAILNMDLYLGGAYFGHECEIWIAFFRLVNWKSDMHDLHCNVHECPKLALKRLALDCLINP
jgi:hypothetical protein